MTIGQRIAQKRKELGLSQEALGEELGVSRQSIYKWESDSALPEIDKLIALSKRFGVSIGALLGVEDEAAGQPSRQEPTPEADGDLTEAQLKMVEEIVDRYLAAQPQPKPRRKWPWVLLAFAVLAGSFAIINRLDQIDRQYQRVQMSVDNVRDSVNGQINGISGRVEEILKSQNNLTAEYGTELKGCDYPANTATFSLRAVPKTYTEGMTAVFVADSGDGPAEYPAEAVSGHAFSGEITVPLTDSISLSVVFIAADGTRSTQLLDQYDWLYSESLPNISLNADLWHADLAGGNTFTNPSPNRLPVGYAYYRPRSNSSETQIRDIRVGLFKNMELLTWAEPCEQPDTFHGFEEYKFFVIPEIQVTLTEEDVIGYAAVITDEYGRTVVCPSDFFRLDEDGTLDFADDVYISFKEDGASGTLQDPAYWHYE